MTNNPDDFPLTNNFVEYKNDKGSRASVEEWFAQVNDFLIEKLRPLITTVLSDEDDNPSSMTNVDVFCLVCEIFHFKHNRPIDENSDEVRLEILGIVLMVIEECNKRNIVCYANIGSISEIREKVAILFNESFGEDH